MEVYSTSIAEEIPSVRTNNTGSTAVTTDLSKCTNSSAGEIGGNTLVSYNLNFINGYLNGTVPTRVPAPVHEPGTWALMILGFGAIGFGMRRRKRSPALRPITC